MIPILYSFRRCPYAMRARLAIAASGVPVHLREVVLRNKPPAFLAASSSATVPCLDLGDRAIDESLDIMRWALEQSDPEGWLDQDDPAWIARADGPFKQALDRTKYHSRYPGTDPLEERAKAAAFLSDLNAQLDPWIGARAGLADYAILPFVRQFAMIDKPWFDAQPWPAVQAWLEQFLMSERFAAIMTRYAPWQEGDEALVFNPPGPDSCAASPSTGQSDLRK